MPPTFLPALRGKALALADEQKTIAFADFYRDVVGAGGFRTTAGRYTAERAVVEGFERVIWVFKAVSTIAADSARLPYRLREGDAEVDDHPLYRVLNIKANPLETGKIFRKRLSGQVLLSRKGAFVEKTVSNRGSIKRVDLLPPDRVEIIPGTGDELIKCYQLSLKGGGVRNIDPEKVLWFRDPHLLDPYSGTSTLEAARLSAELDHYARLYNVSFMQNDGRPGGVLAVRKTDGQTGDISPTSMNRIEERFGKGPVEAGKLSVIAGELDYVDLATRPRDMQYGKTAENAKLELLAAFGMPESVLGNASGRTFDNADAELYSYWTRTMPAHNEILLDGFESDSDDALQGYFDTSSVEVLERSERAKRAEAREEVAAGLRSPYSYAQLAHIDDVEDTVYTRSLYIANGKTPLPSRATDASLLGLDTSAPAAGGAPAAGSADPALPAGPAAPALGAPDDVGAAPGVPGDPPGAPVTTGAAPVAPGVDDGIDYSLIPQSKVALPSMAQRQAKARRLRLIGGGASGPKVRTIMRLSHKDQAWAKSDLDEAVHRAVEQAIQEALIGLREDWLGKATARARSPKQRKNTRHWTPEYDRDTRLGTKAMDAAKVVDEQQWQNDAQEKTHPVIEAAAIAAALVLLTDIGIVAPSGKTLREVARAAVSATVGEVVGLIGRSAARQARRLVAAVNTEDQEGATITAIVTLIEGWGSRLDSWAEGLAVQAGTATLNGARDDAAVGATEVDPHVDIRREWVTRHDDRVRSSHEGADGQSRGVHEPFIVGDSLLRYPGDPLAPVHETANCFPAETVVGDATVVGSYQSWYEGPMVTVRASGRVLTGTPNHPVLTDRGWVGLGLLNVGDNLVCATVREAHNPTPGANRSGAPDVENVPALIGQVHRSLAQGGLAHRVSGLSVNFHGDRPSGQVEVVLADRPLSLGIETTLPEHLRQLALTEPDLTVADRATRRPSDQLVSAASGAASRFVSGGSESGALFGRESRHAHATGLGATSRGDATEAQPSVDRGSCHAVGASQREDRLASQEAIAHVEGDCDPRGAELAKVTAVSRNDWAGHVYNLETLSGTYSANGVIVHNCRCHLRHRHRRTGTFVANPLTQRG